MKYIQEVYYTGKAFQKNTLGGIYVMQMKYKKKLIGTLIIETEIGGGP